MTKFYRVGDAVRTIDGKVGTVQYIKVRNDRNVYGIKSDAKFTPKDYDGSELEMAFPWTSRS